MRPRHAVLPSLSISSRLPKLLSCELIAPEGPRFALFVFNRLHTVSFSVSRKSLAYPCSENGRKSFGFITALPPLPLIPMLGGAPKVHAVSCENGRGECQEFPFWNSPLVITAAILVLSFHALTNCPFCKPFVLIFIHVMGGCTPLHGFALCYRDPFVAIPCSPSPIPCLFKSLRTLLLFFAPKQNLSLFFSSHSALFAKNTRVGGVRALSSSASGFSRASTVSTVAEGSALHQSQVTSHQSLAGRIGAAAIQGVPNV